MASPTEVVLRRAAALALAHASEETSPPPPDALALPPPQAPHLLYHKLPPSLLVLVILTCVCICCGCTFVLSHWCGMGKKFRAANRDGLAHSEIYGAYSEYWYGPNNDGRGADGLKSYRTKQDAAEALEVIAERLRRAAVALMIFSFFRLLSPNGWFGVIAACAVTCCASPPGLKGVIKSVKCARCTAIFAAVLSAIIIVGGISLAVFGSHNAPFVDEACYEAEQSGADNVTITEGALSGVTFQISDYDVCGDIKKFFDHAVWICLALFILPDIGVLISAICVAHFCSVLRTLSEGITGPMEVSPLVYR